MTATRKLLAAACLVLPAAVFAQAGNPLATPNIDQRQANQEMRIQQGVNSGALTTREANKLERGEQHIQNMESRAKADGVVTAKERVRLERAENVESRKIYREKHDRQHDFNHDGRMDRPLRR